MSHSMSSTSSSVPLADRIPKDTWDSHMHVVDPRTHPLSANAQYTPHPHTLEQALAFEKEFGISNIVLVQPSIYGNDNSCLLDALKTIGPTHGRAVVQFDPEETTVETLKEWHQLGVRGVRLNFKSVGARLDATELRKVMTRYANAIRSLDWVIELYIGLDSIPLLEDIIPDLGVKVCVAHFAHPALPEHYSTAEETDPHSLPGFSALVSLLQQGQTWVKFSGAYRIEKVPHMRLVQPMAVEILRVAENRVVYATDWPHTRFEGIDVEPFTEACLDWCQAHEGSAEKLFRRNAEILWDVK